MSQASPSYTPQETLFSSGRTLVQRAVRNIDKQSVILKSIESDYPSLAQLQRFSFSYEVVKKFNHPNIIKVIDYIETDNSPIMVIEDTHAIDLRHYIKTFPDNRLPLKVFLNIAIQLADALSVIHHAQVIHKDLHPGNMVINPDNGQVQIIDFGLASLLNREQPALLRPEVMEGVLAYMSPEQTGRMNRALDYRTDFYTLGITCYELLTGYVPFTANDALGLVHAHIAKVQIPAVEACPDIPAIISNIIDKLLDKTAEGRYQSALGLKKDLEKCKFALASNRPLQVFPLGMEDISDRFQVPQKLYGREDDVATLMQHFYQVVAGSPQLLAISGYSGIGKSALVHEVHKPIAAHNGLFITGKFDQFQRNVPYSALQQALKIWLQHVLALPESKLQQKQHALNQTLGANARVLIDFMTEFKPLLGELPNVPTLGAEESKNRFHRVFLQLIKLITQEKPLVLFIDDLQWADRGTLNLLTVLMSEPECHLLVIVAYRDNEVDEIHPAWQTLQAIKTEQAESICSLTLGPLPLEEINQLLTDALHRPSGDVQPLAQLIIQKTAGNPFFINEFLKTLYSEELLNFDLKQHGWQWDIEAINAKDITGNVVELMLEKMLRLPSETQKLLQLASCIGSSFDLEIVAVVAEQSVADVTRLFWPAIKEGLLIQTGGDWLIGVEGKPKGPHQIMSNGVEYNTSVLPLQTQCKFLHDRMLQAAYESLPDELRQQTHLSIGRLLYKHVEPKQVDHQLFAIIEQLNQGRNLIETEPERLQLARLNLQAAEKAKQASVWEVAVRYAQIGVSLLPETCWKTDYSTSYALHLIRIECEFLVSNYEEGKQLAEVLINRAQAPLEKAQICLLLLSQTASSININFSIEKGLEGLRYCNIQIPDITQVNDHLIRAEHQAVKHLLTLKNRGTIEPSNKSIPSEISLVYRLYSKLMVTLKVAGKQHMLSYLACKAIRTAMENGQNEQTIAIYSHYSCLLSYLREYQEADRIAQATLTLVEQYPQCPDLPAIYNALGSTQWHYNHPLQESVELQLKAHEIGLEYGDIQLGVFAGYSNATINKYAQGLPLSQLDNHLKTLFAIIQKYNIKTSAGRYYRRLVDMLTLPNSKNQLNSSAFTTEEWQVIQSCVIKSFIEHLQLQWFFWSGQIEDAWQAVKMAEPDLKLMSGFITPLEHRFLAALLACKQYPQADAKTQVELNQYLNDSLDELKTLTPLCAANFEHKYHLLLAEQGRYQNHPMEDVVAHYEKAIESAKANKFIQYQALANELFALYWQSREVGSAFKGYLKAALYLYNKWGCKARINYLKKEHGTLISSPSQNSLSSFSLSETESHTSSQNSDDEGLDFDSVMKSARVISSELKLKKLAVKVMKLIAENVGAQIAALILNSESGPQVEAIVSGQSNGEPQALDQCDKLPINIINYVLRTNTLLNLPNVADENPFKDDPYLITQPPQSILCVPVNYRDKHIGVLYLENHLTPNAFTQSRLNVIEMLLSQAAISIENARLFEEVSALNLGLEQKVVERTQQLNDSNRAMLAANEELKSFSYTVSHDLRSPLNIIKGYSEILLDDYEDQLDADGGDIINCIIASTRKMTELINGLMALSLVQQKEIELKSVSLSDLAQKISNELSEEKPDVAVSFNYVKNITVSGDKRMLYSVMQNLLSNAWKYSSKVAQPKVEFGVEKQNEKTVYFVKDNGAGFDMSQIKNLFGVFKRLHSEREFPGTGIGLATAKRIINKHSGEIWAEAEVDKGARFYFTLEA